jgi:PAS domain S-box-containing protein
MRTKSIITLSVVCSILISFVIAFLAFAVLQDMSAEISRNEIFQKLKKNTSAMQFLTLSFDEESVQSDFRQMNVIFQSLHNILETLTAETIREEALITQLKKGYGEIAFIINHLMNLDPISEGNEKERRKILSGQIWIKAQLISDDTDHLIDISDERIVSAHARTFVLILVLIFSLTITISIIYLVSGRNIIRSQQALQENEKRFRMATNAAKIGIYSRDLMTGKDYWSPEFLAIYGYNPPDTMPLKEGIPATVHPDDFAHVLAQADIWFRQSSTSEFSSEHRIIRPDGNIGWVMIRGFMEFDTQRKPLRIYGLAMDITDRKQAEVKLHLLNQTLEQRVAERTELAEKRALQLQSLSMELIETEERERRKISQFLHEDLQQDIAAARLMIQNFLDKYTDEPMLKNIENILAEAINKSRQTAKELSPPILEHSSFNYALEWLVRQMSERFGLKIDLEKNTKKELNCEPIKIFIFRALQELLFNAHKHSGVKGVRVRLSGQDDKIIVIVDDQGRGFDSSIIDSTIVKDCFGLMSLRERARYMGGDLLIESAPEKGSKFTLFVPLFIEQSKNKLPNNPTENKTKIR